MIARIADVNFSPTRLSAQNLINEKVHGSIYTVGNSVLDNLVEFGKPTMLNKILITLHRRENHHWMNEWFEEIEKLANVTVVEPLEHKDLIKILMESNLIISDSGGLQEEGSFFNKKVIVCRKTTERPEGIETGHLHLCDSPKDLSELFGKLIENPYISENCPYGDGYTSEAVLQILRNEKL